MRGLSLAIASLLAVVGGLSFEVHAKRCRPCSRRAGISGGWRKMPPARAKALKRVVLQRVKRRRKKGAKLVRSVRVEGRLTVAGRAVDAVSSSYYYALPEGDLDSGKHELWFFVGNTTPAGVITIGHPGVSGSRGAWTIFPTSDRSSLHAVTWEVWDGAVGVSNFRIIKVDSQGKPHVVARPRVRGKRDADDHLMWAARCGEQTFVCLSDVGAAKHRDTLYRVTPAGFEKVSPAARRTLQRVRRNVRRE